MAYGLPPNECEYSTAKGHRIDLDLNEKPAFTERLTPTMRECSKLVGLAMHESGVLSSVKLFALKLIFFIFGIAKRCGFHPFIKT